MYFGNSSDIRLTGQELFEHKKLFEIKYISKNFIKNEKNKRWITARLHSFSVLIKNLY